MGKGGSANPDETEHDRAPVQAASLQHCEYQQRSPAVPGTLFVPALYQDGAPITPFLDGSTAELSAPGSQHSLSMNYTRDTEFMG